MALITAKPPRSQAARRALRPAKPDHRRLLLRHATQLFGTVGYHRTTLEDIARRADVAPAVLTRHFTDKAAILAALTEEMRSATLNTWPNLTASLGDPLAQLQVVLDHFLKSARALGREFRFLTQALAEETDLSALPEVRSYFEDCASYLARLLADGRKVGLIRRTPQPRTGAWQLLQTVVGASVLHPICQGAGAAATTAETLLNGLLKTDV